MILFIFLWTYPNAQAQTNIPFTPADKFSILSYNGTVSFAVNGTYSKAKNENDTWTFTNLNLNGSKTLQNFRFSAQNSNVTIYSYLTFNTTRQSTRLRYTVEGQGKQILSLGLGSQAGKWASLDWSVITVSNTGSNVFLAEGEDWTISQYGTLVVAGATGNVTIIQWGFFVVAWCQSQTLMYLTPECIDGLIV